jgi:outer membrane protein assembly factor BamB
LWKFKASGIIVSSPVHSGKSIFIGSYDSTFYSLDENTGKVHWKFRTGGQIGSTAAILDERIYFFSSDGKLYCLDKTRGTMLWNFKTFGGALPDRRYDWPDYYQSSPAIADGKVYFGAGDGRVYALDASSGKVLWSYQTGDVVHTKPAISEEKLLIGSFDGFMYCLNRESGALVWRFKTTGHRYFPRGEINGNPVVHRKKVIFGARDYNLYAVDLEAGYCHWIKTFPFGWALPVTPNDTVLYVGTSDDRILLAVNEESGQIQWRKNLGFNNFAAMSLHGKSGYTGTLNGKLFSIDLNTGDIRWTFHTDGYKTYRDRYFQEDDNLFVENIGRILPDGQAILKMYQDLGAIFSQPLVTDNRLVFASNDGVVYCLRL